MGLVHLGGAETTVVVGAIVPVFVARHDDACLVAFRVPFERVGNRHLGKGNIGRVQVREQMICVTIVGLRVHCRMVFEKRCSCE